MEAQAPDTNLQFELLALLAFFDKEAKYVRGIVELKLYDSLPVQRLAREIYDFIDNFSAAPKAHFSEIISKYFTGDEKETYEQIFNRITRLRQGLNPDYVVSKLDEFMANQTLQLGIIEAYDALEKKDIEKAREIMYRASKKHAGFADPGMFLSQAAPLIYAPDLRGEFTMGLKALDERRFVPARQELMMLLGLSGRNKSWWLIHIGAANMKLGKKVLHITLEMGLKQCMTRYVQNLMWLTRSAPETMRYFDIESGPMRQYIATPQTRHAHGLHEQMVMDKIGEKLEQCNRILVKDWPENTLTIPKLEGYLDMVEQTQGFMPDELVVDYPELFFMANREERRIEVGDVWRGLRRLAKERNMSVVAASQSNRSGTDKLILGEKEVSEDFSKYMTADMVGSLNMTNEEKELGLARFYALKNRDDADRFCVVVSQAIAAGQVALGGVLYNEREYQKFLAQYAGSAALDDSVP